MARSRPLEDKRARRGLGARSAQGETTPAAPRGRMTGAPGGSRQTMAGKPGEAPKGNPHASKAERAQRRTVRDNPAGGRHPKQT